MIDENSTQVELLTEVDRLRALLQRHMSTRAWNMRKDEDFALYLDTMRGMRGEAFVPHACEGTA